MECDPNDMEGGLYTLGLLEKLRAECKDLWGATSASYLRVEELVRELGNPNLHEIFPVSALDPRAEAQSDFEINGGKPISMSTHSPYL
jgi:hypothetical protein